MQRQALRILLIDDNKHGLIARRTLLEEFGCVVETAPGGREGLKKFSLQPFDLVVTDYRMPDLGGEQVLKEIRQKNARVPVVILSGYVERLGLTEQSTGADAVVAKGPTEERDLVRTVARLMKKKPGSQTLRAATSSRPRRISS